MRGEEKLVRPLSFLITCAIIYDASPVIRTPAHLSPMRRQQQSKQYSCPTLSFDEIISNFFSWGFSISHEQLLRPSHEFVSSIYWICLNRVKDLSQDGLADAATATTTFREHPVSLISQPLFRSRCNFCLPGPLRACYKSRCISSPHVNSLSSPCDPRH